MNKANKFEDLIAWQKARKLTKAVYTATRNGDFSKDFGLSSQMQRAAVSVMSNLAEGFERGSRADFHRYLVTAKASCAEVRCQLYAALDNDYLGPSEFSNLIEMAEEVGRIIGGLRVAVEKQKKLQMVKA